MRRPRGALDRMVPAPGRMRHAAVRWLVALALLVPAFSPYLAHYWLAPGGAATGFIQLEMPYYMANAREHFDGGGFHLTYANPFSARVEPSRIYFQPQTLALGLLWRLTGWEPGAVFVAFGFLAGWVCMRLVVALYEMVAGLRDGPRRLGLVLFAWGGGVLALAGYARGYFQRGHLEYADFLALDPFGGWWFLNLGRNLILPTEAYYHALFLGTILCLLVRKYALACVLMAICGISHPFTGIELLLIVACWAFLERYFLSSGVVPLWFPRTVAGLSVAHLAYYLVFLGGDSEHRALSAQWALPWTLDAPAFVPAYLLVGLLAAWGMRQRDRAAAVLSRPRNRLFLVWFLVAFTLANHEFAVRPVQPLHFTRGYIWTPLFLLGCGSLLALLESLPARLGRVPGLAAVVAVALLFLADNALWLSSFPIQAARGFAIADVRLSPDQQALFERLGRRRWREHTLVCRDPMLGFLVAAYTPLRTWQGHGANTPHHEQRAAEIERLFSEGRLIGPWRRRPTLVVLGADAPAGLPARLEAQGARLVESVGPYRLYGLTPVPSTLARQAGETAPR